jgi:plastocyanin
MKDFVVYVEGPFKEKPAPPTVPVSVITQKGANFTPHVLPVMVGTKVEWPNKDDILHNVFSDSDAKRFDLGLYKDEIKTVSFDTKGRVDVFCSIHSKMHCIILVLDTPYFARTNEKGFYSITNVPPGTYQVRAWHERLPSQTQKVVVPENSREPVRLNIQMGIKNLPKL